MIIDITKYCSADDAAAGTTLAINDAKSGDTIVFPKNEYHFYKDRCQHRVYHMTNTDSFVKPDKFFGILIEDKEDITIDGNGSVFVIHGDMCALAAVRTKNLTLKNFTVRYNAPTNIEMTVKKKSAFKIKYEIPENNRFYMKKNSVYFYEESPFTKEKYYTLKNDTNTYFSVVHRGNEVFRTLSSPLKMALKIKQTGENEIECLYLIPPKFRLGDTVAISQSKCRDTCGLFFWECRDVKSENLTVNYMHGFGWLSQMCENLTFEKITFKAADGYKVSTFADCIHVCGCKGFVNISDCLFTHPHDDGINIHGAFLRTEKVIDERTVTFEFVHKQQGGYSAFYPNDKVKFYSRKDLSEIDGVYTVKSVSDDINGKKVTVTFNEKLPPLAEKLTVCENITYNPEVTVKNCIFKAIPTRGILCTTDKKAEIFGNVFESLKMPDIYVSCDCKQWYESGPCKNLIIHDNVFSNEKPILFEPLCIGKPVENVHENIKIFSNKYISNGEEKEFIYE